MIIVLASLRLVSDWGKLPGTAVGEVGEGKCVQNSRMKSDYAAKWYIRITETHKREIRGGETMG